MLKVRDVHAHPDFKLTVRFSDGTRGDADFRPMLDRRPFQKLRDVKLFAKAYVDHGAVTWPDDIDIATETLYAMVHDLPKPDTVEQAIANEREMSLRELRGLSGLTQVEISEAMEIDQGQLSRFERQGDMHMSTLRRYVQALGGKLEIVAVLGDKRVAIRGI